MLKYDFSKSAVTNIKHVMAWINHLLSDGNNLRHVTQEQIDEQIEIEGEHEYRLCLLELGVTENDL